MNYQIIRISYQAPCLIGFCSILFFTEFLGIFVALWDHDWTCLLSSACFGVIFGALGSLLIFLFLFLYNLLLPITKGISVQLHIADIPSTTIVPQDANEPSSDKNF